LLAGLLPHHPVCGSHPFTCPLAANTHIPVVGVARKAMAAPFQFLVYFVSHSRPGLVELLDGLPAERKPALVRGDCK